MTYVIHILNVAAIFGILAVSLNLVAGYTGMISVAHAAFFGIGAYLHAILSLRYGTSLPLNAVVSVFFAGALAAAIGNSLRAFRGDAFVMGTFALQVLVLSVFNNFASLTGGPMGLPGIPRLTVFEHQASTPFAYLVLSLAALGAVAILAGAITSSSLGRVLCSIREDSTLVETLGKDEGKFRVSVFALSGAMASLAGVLYAGSIGFIDPTSFTITDSILILSMVIIGGAGTFWGPVVGSSVLVLIPELLRSIGLQSSVGANLRQIIYGALLVIIVLFRPEGILGHYSFGRTEKRE